MDGGYGDSRTAPRESGAERAPRAGKVFDRLAEGLGLGCRHLGPGCRARSLFLALTVVVVMVIILMSPSPAFAIAACLAILALTTALMLGSTYLDDTPRRPGAEHREGFPAAGLPGAHPPYAAASLSWAPRRDGRLPAGPAYPGAGGGYPGAIDPDEYESEAAYGHRDRLEGDNEAAAYGNPYNTGRVAYPAAADSCMDDEANDDELDGDERNTYQARSRNDMTRVTAGTMNRRRDLDKYFREEVEEAEDREWWGRHEE